MAAQRIVSARLEAAQRRHYSAVHIEARVAQVREIETQVAAERAVVQAQADAQAHRLADRLWMPPGLRARLARQQAQALSMLDAFAGRLAAARAGFAALPRDDSATDAQPPEPVAMVAPTSDAPTSATDGAAGGAAAAERMRDVA
jgi:MoxR-like ATPase